MQRPLARSTDSLRWTAPMRLAAGLAAGLFGATGCSSSGVTATEDLSPGAAMDDADIPGADLGPLSCAPALTIGPTAPIVNPFGLATFKGAGGTGSYRFALADAKSGALVNEISGAYLAGGMAGVDDVIEVTDTGCLGSARSTVKVVPHIEVRPSNANVPPATKFKLDVRGGSGMFSFTLLQAGSGATLTAAGDYAAGGKTGLDSVKVVDTATGDSAIADISVDPNSRVIPTPALVMMPAGATFKLKVQGGSGHLDATTTGNSATYKDGLITGVSAGATTLDLTDAFTGQKARVRVDVSAAQKMSANRAGDQFSAGWIASARTAAGAWQPMDLDGDGLADAALGNPESDVDAFNSGAVYLYRGAKGGPAAKADRVISGEGREDNFGRGMAAGDFDGDGEIDLAVGAPRADAGATDNGAVYLYKGMGNMLLSPKPVQVLAGAGNHDYFGWSVAACDFNGDGRLDLAVGSVLGEDLQAMPRTYDQGAVSIFLSYPDGFLTRPDAVVYGQIPDAQGKWRGVGGLQMAWSIGAGDVDGDGKCDLIAGTIYYNSTSVTANPDPARPNDGAVWVFAGVGPNGPAAGGVRSTPSRFYAGGDADINSQFSRNLTAGDLDGDGKAEIIVGQAWADPVVMGRTLVDAGAVRVFAGGQLSQAAPSTWIAASKADASYLGSAAYNYLGFHVGYGEASGDTVADLIVGHWIDDLVVGDGGAVRVYAGRKGAMPDLQPARNVGGTQIGERMGQVVAAPGDMDGDGKNDLLAYAGLTDVADATDVGAPYFIDGSAMPAPRQLEMPGQPGGAWFGYSSALLDFNNDGFTDLVVGGSQVDPVFATKPQSGLNAGAVQVYLGTNNGIPADPSFTLKQFIGHSDWDMFGWRVAPAGDFDGDGLQDLAVVSRYEDVTGPLSDPRYDVGACMEKVRYDAGAVYVFRGSRGGVPGNEPAFVLYGPQQSFRIDTLDGGMDVNGDGKGDLVIGSWDWRNNAKSERTGGFMVVSGRAATPGKTRVMCDPALVAFGSEVNALLGIAVSGVPDLDGDGCAEVAVGATDEHLNNADNVPYQGSVRVIFGWGGARCPVRPRMALLRSKEAYSRVGTSISAADLDQDGIPELAVGAWNHVTAGSAPGGAWLVPGTYLRSLGAGALVIAGHGDLADPPYSGMIPNGTSARLLVEGGVTGELFGQGVALLPDVGNGRGGLAVGAPLSDVSGAPQSGGVRLYQYLGAKDGLDPLPLGIFGGETARTGARVGENVFAGKVNGVPALVVSAHFSSATALDYGTAYAAPIHLP